MIDVLEPQIDRNGKSLFNYIKKLNKENIGIEALKLDGKITTDPGGKLEALARVYESVWKNENTEDIPLILPSPFPDMADFDVSEAGVLSQLTKLNVHKSTGPDGIAPNLLKMLGPTISPILTSIYRQSLKLNTIPKDWKIQYVTPILKPGKDKTEPSSYRPIALTCVCSKILEHIVYSQIMDHLDQHKILSPYQHGYRSGSSTETQLLRVIDKLARGLQANSQVDAIALDFQRAFDVPHCRLLLKMQYYGIRKLNPWF